MFELIASVVILLLAIPIGICLARLTSDEKEIYKKYFSWLIWIVAIAAAIFYSIDLVIALSLSFMFLVLVVWERV